METASQTVVIPDNLPVRFQDMQFAAQIAARPTEMMQSQGVLERAWIQKYSHSTDLFRNGSRKAEKNPTSNVQSFSTQQQRLSDSTDCPIMGNT